MSISISGLSHHYGQQAVLKDIDLQVAEGEVVALLGPSGCGKTSLLRLIAGLETVQQGEIHLSGQRVADQERFCLPPEQRAIGMMFQDYALFPHLSVQQNLNYGLRSKQQRSERRAWLHNMLDGMGMLDMLDRFPHTLSGGQQQRVALLRALAPKPAIMLLDEPFSALDEHLRQQVREETLDVLKRSGAASVVVTHDPLEAMFIADKIVVMEQGRIVQVASPQQVYQQPVNAFVAALFGPANCFVLSAVDQELLSPVGKLVKPSQYAECYQVIVRAKDIQVSLEPQVDAVAAELISIHAMGDQTHLRLRGENNAVVQVRSRVDQNLTVGQALWLSVPEDGAFIFAEDLYQSG